jgi:hypothetical protein
MRNRRAGWVIAAAVLAVLAVRHPTANIEILTHDSNDPLPHRLQAGADLGLAGFSVLVTWSAKRLAH